MEWLFFPDIWSKCWSWPNVHSLTYFVCSLSLLLLYILEKRLKNLNIPVSLIFFVDDGLIISQNKSIDISNSQLFCNYNVLFKLLVKFGLNIKYSKTETFHFSRFHRTFNSSLLDLSSIGGPILHSKSS